MTAQVPIYNLRSGTADKRPTASGLAFGQIAINYNEVDPAIYLRGHSDDLVKVGPVYIGSTAPNATPASGGASGNTVGEQWLDTTNGDFILKIWDGSAWRTNTVTSAEIKGETIVNNDISSSAAIALSKLATGALPSGITVDSSNIINGSIVNADINSAAAIALTKLDTGALPTGITITSGNVADSSIVKSGDIGVTVEAFDATILKSANIGVSVQAYDADTAKTDVAQTFTSAQRGAIATLAGSGVVTPDFGAANNFAMTLSGTTTLAFPSGVVSGQSGIIRISQTGSFVVTYSGAWQFPDALAPSNSVVSGRSDVLVYYAHSNSAITAQLLTNVA